MFEAKGENQTNDFRSERHVIAPPKAFSLF